MIFKPSLLTDSRAQSPAALGSDINNSDKERFRKHNCGSTLLSKNAQVLDENIGTEPERVCQASLIDICRVKKSV